VAHWLIGSVLMLACAAPASAVDRSPPGERVGGKGQDDRVGKRVNRRLSTRLDTRVDARATFDPLASSSSKITADQSSVCGSPAGFGVDPDCQSIPR
jgi:hypothetical protein